MTPARHESQAGGFAGGVGAAGGATGYDQEAATAALTEGGAVAAEGAFWKVDEFGPGPQGTLLLALASGSTDSVRVGILRLRIGLFVDLEQALAVVGPERGWSWSPVEAKR